MKKLILFDFDGTLTSKDTLFEIARYSTSHVNYMLKIGLLIPVFIFVKLSLISKQKGKELFLKSFFKGMNIDKFNDLCAGFCQERVYQIIRPKALNEIHTYSDNTTEMYIVSASPENWIKPWADQFKIKVLSTQLEVINDKLTGNIDGVNCNGEEKVNRIKQNINLEQFDEIIAYGDTIGDIPMLDIANVKNFKPFQ